MRASKIALLNALLLCTASVGVAVDLMERDPAEDDPNAASRLAKRAMVIKRGLCTPTGPGVCNFGLENQEPALSDITQNLYIFDRYCDVIGSTYEPDSLPFSFTSQLKYVVVVYEADTLTSCCPRIKFAYAGQTIDSANGQCACGGCSDGLAGCESCQCAFDC